MITPDEIGKLDKKTIFAKLEELGLEPHTRNVAKLKQDLRIWLYHNCDHSDKRKAFDVSPCLCPVCESLLSYDEDSEGAACENCDFTGDIEEHGALDTWDTFMWLDECIYCFKCEYDGHPKEITVNPFESKVEEMLDGSF